MSEFTEQAPVDGVHFDGGGLLPCVVQDAGSGEVLTLARMNREAFRRILETGVAVFHPHTMPGEGDGGILRVAEIKLNRDGDALVARVLRDGPNGEADGFFKTVFKSKEVLSEVEEPSAEVTGWGAQFGALMDNVRTLLEERRAQRPDGSYSAFLFNRGLDEILKKLGEETAETIIAAKGEDRCEMIGEMCDLMFHVMVLMVEKNVSFEDIRRVMDKRHRGDQTGRHERAVLEVNISRPEGCRELEKRLFAQLGPDVRREVSRALEVMYRAHKGQRREEGAPYAVHPLEVAVVAVEEVKLREAKHVLTALLHDVLEDDMHTTPAELTEKFGDEVSGAVVTLTKMYKRDGTPRKLGLQRYYQALQRAPGWVRAIKMCDRIHNLRTLPQSGRSREHIDHYRRETRANLLPLAASSVDKALLKAGDLLLQELYK